MFLREIDDDEKSGRLVLVLDFGLEVQMPPHLCIYTVSQKKTRHYNIVHNFTKC